MRVLSEKSLKSSYHRVSKAQRCSRHFIRYTSIDIGFVRVEMIHNLSGDRTENLRQPFVHCQLLSNGRHYTARFLRESAMVYE